MNCEGCLNMADCEQCDCDEGYFRVGQIVTLKGRVFRVGSVESAELKLELVRELHHERNQNVFKV